VKVGLLHLLKNKDFFEFYIKLFEREKVKKYK